MASRRHVSAKNRDLALENIHKKIELLQKWVKDGVPVAASENSIRYPTSLRKFNAWDCSDIESWPLNEQFVSNAAETLRNEPELTNLVIDLMRALKNVCTPPKNRRHVSEESRLRTELSIETLQRKAAEKRLGEVSLELARMGKKCQNVEAKMKNQEQEIASFRKSLSARVNELEKENQNLVKQISKVTPLKRAK